jgi:hypothetical protein
MSLRAQVNLLMLIVVGGFIFVQNYAAHAQRVCVCIHYDDQGRCTLVTCR